jgi:hypothetical protein
VFSVKYSNISMHNLVCFLFVVCNKYCDYVQKLSGMPFMIHILFEVCTLYESLVSVTEINE